MLKHFCQKTIFLPVFWLAVAALVYGGFSRPAPAAIGPAELVMVVSLAIAVMMQWRQAPPGKIAIMAAWCLWLAVMIGWGRAVIEAAPAPLIWRDVVPVLLWLVPCLMIVDAPGTSPCWLGARWLGVFFALGGLLMAARFWATAPSLIPGTYNGWPDYLANDPLLWFAGLWFVGQALQSSRRGGWLVILLAVPCLAALVMTLQRAVLGASLVALLGLCWTYRRHRRVWIFAAIAMMVMVALPHDWPVSILASLWHKQQALGWNSRDLEWQSLFRLLSEDGASIWFGRGWGSTFASPAVGEWRVAYVHSLAGYLVFKLGMVGLVLWLAMIGMVARIVWQSRQQILWVVMPSLLVPLSLSTAYKFPGFLLVLCFLVQIKSSSADNNNRKAVAS